ncbi:MAG: hypothetical protein PHN82_03120 [bacterium]|nr:hypothetical protein [bacterium]
MGTGARIWAVAAAAVACGCAAPPPAGLRAGMGKGEVIALLGRPDDSHALREGASRREIWVYRNYRFRGVPNVLAGHGYLIPPAFGSMVRVEFLDNALQPGPFVAAGRQAPARRAPAPAAPTPVPADDGEFSFEGIRFGMGKEEVEEAVNAIAPSDYRKRIYASTGGEYGDFMVNNPSHEILSLYFKFDDRGRLYWLKAQYPYSLTEAWKTEPLRERVRARHVKPARRRHRDVEVQFDERRMRLLLFSKPLEAEFRRRAGRRE